MILFCRYGVDAREPAKGCVVAYYDDAAVPPAGTHPGCLAVPDAGPIERFGRFGPAPALMGDAPADRFASHAELTAEGIPDAHPLREIAGQPITADNRRPEIDFRPWCAPDLTPDVARAAKRIEIGRALDAAEAGGFVSGALGAPHRYPSDADGLTKLQLAALAALGGQSKPGWTASLRCAEVGRETLATPHKAAQVHAVLADYQAFADGIHAERDAALARIAGAETVDDILAATGG